MTSIFVHVDALISSTPAEDRRGGSDVSLAPGAVDALRHLVDSGYRIVVVGTLPDAVAGDLDVPFETGSDVAGGNARGSWLVVADPEECRARRRPGLRTMYVGPRRPPEHRPTARCDTESRDLASAAIEILTEDAMAPEPNRT